MLKQIKSKYFIQLIYTYVDEKQKLKLLRYNKDLQKNININIMNYRHFKGRYIIYESKGIGKEYDKNDILIYEGEYLNGEKHGKGKRYKDDNIIFEGEYLNGKRNGKGKEYKFVKIVFEGENPNGELNSKRKEYEDLECHLIYEGEYSNGKRNGKGKAYHPKVKGKIKFEGEYLNGKEWIGTRN